MNVILICRTATPKANEAAAKALLEGRGDTVRVVEDSDAETLVMTDGTTPADVVVSLDAIAGSLGTKYRDAAVGHLAASFFTWYNGQALSTNANNQSGQTQINVVDGAHFLADGLSTGLHTVMSSGEVNRNVGVPAAASVAANSPSGNASLFSFEAGDGGAGGVTFNARRVGFFTYEIDKLNATGDSLFLNAVDYAAGLGGNTAPGTPTVTVDTAGVEHVEASSSSFSDVDLDTHALSQWQVTTAADTTFTTPVIDTGDDPVQLQTYRSPDNWLRPSTDYLIRVRHNDGTAWSEWSTGVAFTTADAGWLTGSWQKRQLISLTASDEHQLGDWVQWATTDAALVGLPAGDGDIAVALADGTRLPTQVITRDGATIRVSVALPAPASSTRALHGFLYVGSGGAAAWTPTAWGGRATSPTTAVGPTGDVIDGRGNTSAANTNWVHPRILRVPTSGAGAWMRKVTDGAGDTVTHVRVDTPYPAADDDYENPYLLYSTDDGATWSEWPGAINPITARPSNAADFNSDVSCAITPAGDLVVVFRLTSGGTYTLQRQLITAGASLTSASVGTAASATRPDPSTTLFVAPTLVYVGSRLFMFYASAGAIFREQSDDDGLTWSNKVEVISDTAATGDGEYTTAEDYWHGQVIGPVGGTYFLAFSAHDEDTAPIGDAAYARIFRSRDLTRWEASRRKVVVAGEGGAINSADTYSVGLERKADGSWFLYLSGDQTGGSLSYTVGTVALPELEGLQSLTQDEAFRFDMVHTTSYSTAGDRGAVTALGSVEDANTGAAITGAATLRDLVAAGALTTPEAVTTGAATLPALSASASMSAQGAPAVTGAATLPTPTASAEATTPAAAQVTGGAFLAALSAASSATTPAAAVLTGAATLRDLVAAMVPELPTYPAAGRITFIGRPTASASLIGRPTATLISVRDP